MIIVFDDFDANNPILVPPFMDICEATSHCGLKVILYIFEYIVLGVNLGRCCKFAKHSQMVVSLISYNKAFLSQVLKRDNISESQSSGQLPEDILYLRD